MPMGKCRHGRLMPHRCKIEGRRQNRGMALTPKESDRISADARKKLVEELEGKIDQHLSRQFRPAGHRVIKFPIADSTDEASDDMKDELRKRFGKSGWDVLFESTSGVVFALLRQRAA